MKIDLSVEEFKQLLAPAAADKGIVLPPGIDAMIANTLQGVNQQPAVGVAPRR